MARVDPVALHKEEAAQVAEELIAARGDVRGSPTPSHYISLSYLREAEGKVPERSGEA